MHLHLNVHFMDLEHFYILQLIFISRHFWQKHFCKISINKINRNKREQNKTLQRLIEHFWTKKIEKNDYKKINNWFPIYIGRIILNKKYLRFYKNNENP